MNSIRTVVALGALVCVGASQAIAESAVGSKSGLPVPRFVSLKPDRVNVRGGPTRDHEVTFVYTRAGLPVEITAESDNWRRIRDWEGFGRLGLSLAAVGSADGRGEPQGQEGAGAASRKR